MASEKLRAGKLKDFALFFRKRFSITSWPFLIALVFLALGLAFQSLWIFSAIGGFIIFIYFIIWIVWLASVIKL
ncbi:MAG: hypothetical protein AABW79_02245 [Nanoarchaeota archaeon]